MLYLVNYGRDAHPYQHPTPHPILIKNSGAGFLQFKNLGVWLIRISLKMLLCFSSIKVIGTDYAD